MVDASTVVCGKGVSVGVNVGVAEGKGTAVDVAVAVVTGGIVGTAVGGVCPARVHATNIKGMMNKSSLCTECSFSAFLSVADETLQRSAGIWMQRNTPAAAR